MYRGFNVGRAAAGLGALMLLAALARPTSEPARELAALRERQIELFHLYDAACAEGAEERDAELASGGDGLVDVSKMSRFAEELRRVDARIGAIEQNR